MSYYKVSDRCENCKQPKAAHKQYRDNKPPHCPEVPIHPRADLVPAIIAWNTNRATVEQLVALRKVGYVSLSGGQYQICSAGREAGLK
jgi:hypothetical protein